VLENIPVIMKEVDTEEADVLVQEAGWYGAMRPVLGDSTASIVVRDISAK
jgi:hypothetical protein